MKLPLYQVDSFTDRVFGGNPAAICPLRDEWPDDSIMQKIAAENNLAETGFFIFRDGQYHIRWFTPRIEVDLCGHATLAAAFVLFNHENLNTDSVSFLSRSGILSVKKNDGLLVMDFPTDTIAQVECTDELCTGFDRSPSAAYRGKTDYMLVFNNEEEILTMKPDLSRIAKVHARGIIVTAKGSACDFVCRFFAPQSGIDEDPVTGSAYTTLVPYWSRVLGKEKLDAVQLSPRRGSVTCRDRGERTEIAGNAVLYMKGEIII